MLPALSLGKFEANFCIHLCFAMNLRVPVYILWLVVIDEGAGILLDFSFNFKNKVITPETLRR